MRRVYIPHEKIRETFAGNLSPAIINVIEQLLDDSRVRLFVGEYDGGLCIYPYGKKRYYSIVVPRPSTPLPETPNIRYETEGRRYFEEAVKIDRHLCRDGEELYLFQLSVVLNDYGAFSFHIGDIGNSEKGFTEALDIRCEWAEKSPEVWLEFYARSLWNYSLLQQYCEHFDKEKLLLKKALIAYTQLAKKEPGKYKEEIQRIRESLGR